MTDTDDLGIEEGELLAQAVTGPWIRGKAHLVGRAATLSCTAEESAFIAFATPQRFLAMSAELKRLREERRRLLTVHATEGLLASEWVSRTALAEGQRDELRQRIAALEAELEAFLEGEGITRMYNQRAEAIADRHRLEAENRELLAKLSEASAIARVLAHAYQHDNTPPAHMVEAALSYPIDAARRAKESE